MFAFLRRRKAKSLLEQAQQAYRGGDRAGAVLLLEQVIALATEEAGTAAITLSAIERERGDLAEMCRHLERARGFRPDEATLAVQLGDGLRSLGEHTRAMAAYDDALSCANRDAKLERRAVRGAALAAMACGAADAEARLESAVEGYALDLEAWSSLARVYAAIGRVAEARSALQRVLRADRDDLEAHERLLTLSDEALGRSFTRLWRPEPEGALPGKLTITALFEQLRMTCLSEATVEAFAKLAKQGGSPGQLAFASFVLLRVKRLNEARACLATLDVAHLLARFARVVMAIDEGREEDAKELLEHLLADGLPFPELPFILAVREAVLGNPEGAERGYREVLAADPDDAEVSLLLASSLRRREQFAEAHAIARRAYLTNPVLLSEVARFREAVIDGRRLRAARLRLEAQLKVAPGDRQTLLDLMRVCNEMRAYRDALRFATGLDKEASAARGYALFGDGDLEAACREYRACLKQNPEDHVVRALLGQVLAMMKRDAEAEPLLDAAIAGDPHGFVAPATRGILHSQRGDLAAAEIQ